MKVHIVYCHPSNESVTYALKESYVDGLKASNIDFTISDLYKKEFNSDMLKTIFVEDRLNNKAEDINFYFFNETSHDKITPENKESYIKKAFEIATYF